MDEHLTSSGPRARLHAAALIAAPVALLASTAAYIANDGLDSGGATAGAIQVWAGIALGLAMMGLAARLEGPLPRTAAVLTLTSAIGAAGAIAFGIDSMVFATDATAAVSEADPDGLAATLGLFLPGLTMPATLIALGVASLRTGVQPRAAAIALALGGVAFPISRIGGIDALAVVADLLIGAGMVPMGLAALRRLGRTGPVGVGATGAVAA
ncbi:MAG TPA: hypothetical protein VK507_16750 [Iamia sp.]|nr:hypothetical protein [Iamia sp.]